jgi:hypothetical protein
MGQLCFHIPDARGQDFGRVARDLSLLAEWPTPWSRLKYLPGERVWFLSMIDNGHELVIAGDDTRADPARLAIAHAVESRLPELMRHVLDYLDATLDYAAFRSSGEWHLEGFDFGRTPDQPPETFDVMLTTDEYGGWEDCETWYVTCSLGSMGFEPKRWRGGWYGYHLARRRSADAEPGAAADGGHD